MSQKRVLKINLVAGSARALGAKVGNAKRDGWRTVGAVQEKRVGNERVLQRAMEREY